MATKTAPKAGSAQTVGRAIALLRLVASSRTQNLRLVDLAELAELEKSTAHRLLQRLVQERMLVRDAGKPGYRLGPLAHELGLAARPETDLHEASLPALHRLASSTGEMTFLVKRSGFQTVCLDRITGDFPIRTLTRGVGDRHPLGAGAGGMAILAAMDDRELDTVAPELTGPLAPYGLTQDTLRGQVALARARGIAFDDGQAAPDVSAMGCAIHDRLGSPVGAVFIATIKNRLTPRLQADVGHRLSHCVRTIEAAL
jgi:DNA-binding IclR family transcriptional regulator